VKEHLLVYTKPSIMAIPNYHNSDSRYPINLWFLPHDSVVAQYVLRLPV